MFHRLLLLCIGEEFVGAGLWYIRIIRIWEHVIDMIAHTGVYFDLSINSSRGSSTKIVPMRETEANVFCKSECVICWATSTLIG